MFGQPRLDLAGRRVLVGQGVDELAADVEGRVRSGLLRVEESGLDEMPRRRVPEGVPVVTAEFSAYFLVIGPGGSRSGQPFPAL
jgi:hypothetical protein